MGEREELARVLAQQHINGNPANEPRDDAWLQWHIIGFHYETADAIESGEWRR